MKIKLTIDGQQIEAEPSQTVLEAALEAGLYIPHLCYHPDLPSFKDIAPVEVCYRGTQEYRSDNQSAGYGGCGLCLVEIEGSQEPVLSCLTPVEAGMEVVTASPKLKALRQDNLAIILAKHPHACLTCAQREGCSLTQCSTNVPEEERCCPQFDFCELRKVAEYIGIREDISRYLPGHLYVEEDKPLFLRDYNLCVNCLRCVRACQELIGAKALAYTVVNGEIIVGTTQPSLEQSGCRFCGACVEVCPTGALRDKDIKPGQRREALLPCVDSCPLAMDIPSYIKFVADGNYEQAANIIEEKTPLGLSLGYICHHPCEEACRRQEINQALAICDLKRAAMEKAKSKRKEILVQRTTGKRVAIVGSGPAGLAAAYFLAKLGHSVTIYEALPEPGGMLRWAIPEYRLPRAIIRGEVKKVKALGVEIITSSSINKENFISQLLEGEWQAVFLATGLQQSKKIEVEGLNSTGVYWGLDFLRQAKEKKKPELKGKVLVIGGGNVALDVAMTALRLGADRVELACLEKKEEMPAFAWERKEAEEEGVVIYPGWGPRKIERDGSQIKGVELIGCSSVFDEKGTFSPTFDASRRKFIEAETVILAVGQVADLSFLPPELGIRVTEARTIEVNPETLATNIKGLFAGGEAAFGPASAVEAMASGRKAASAIDKFLGGEGLPDSLSELAPQEKKEFWLGEVEGFMTRERVFMPTLSLTKRLHSFDLIQLGLSEEQARQEASRCLRCDLRLKFSPVFLPPEKWLELKPETISQVPETEGVFQLLDKEKKIIYIAGTPHLRQAIQEKLDSLPEAKYFYYEEEPMYTKRESELIQQFLRRHGHLPSGNEEVEDLF